MIRLAHFSDVHVTCPARWSARDWTTKRLSGWANMRLLERSSLFRDAEMVLMSLMEDISKRRPDCVIFSGDACNLGFPEEFSHAATLMRVGQGTPGVAVPGNHDYYTKAAAASGAFEQVFAPWQEGERIDSAFYPFARRVGHVYLIALNSSRANRWFWDASGQVGQAQRDRLARLLALPHIAASPKILVTHYPIGLADGRPESAHHGLTDLKETLETVQAGRVSLWLHGHRHQPYFLPTGTHARIPSVCAGSATQANAMAYYEYAIDGRTLHGRKRRYDPSGQFREVEKWAIDL